MAIDRFTNPDKRQNLIDAGMAFSKWMRIRSTIQIEYREPYFGGIWNDLIQLANLPGRPTIELVDSADLCFIQAKNKDQAHWSELDWAQAIDYHLEIIKNLADR